MKISKQNSLYLFLSVALILTITIYPTLVVSKEDCRNHGPGMSQFAEGPQLNLSHVFCGEYNVRRNRATGFHSRPRGETPDNITHLEIITPANKQGIYEVKITIQIGKNSGTKRSTMFPDSCSREQVIQSILNAAKTGGSCHGQQNPKKFCGNNRPPQIEADNKTYCRALDDSTFTISGWKLDNGNINTAYPIYR